MFSRIFIKNQYKCRVQLKFNCYCWNKMIFMGFKKYSTIFHLSLIYKHCNYCVCQLKSLLARHKRKSSTCIGGIVTI